MALPRQEAEIMSLRRLVPLSGLLLLSGCLYHVQEQTDAVVQEMAARPFDLGPASAQDSRTMPRADEQSAVPSPGTNSPQNSDALSVAPMDVQTTEFVQPGGQVDQKEDIKKKLEEILQRYEKPLKGIPGSEVPRIDLDPKKFTPEQIRRRVEELYPDVPALPAEPTALPGPQGEPYTLATLQQLAAANSPQLRQAASDVRAAWGNLITARAYPNPKIGYTAAPSNDGSTPGFQGIFIDQVVSYGGKLKLAGAAAEMDLRNAELALRRARSDLATAVRNAYYALLVAKETMAVNRALARFTDEVYRIQREQLLLGRGVAAYEPATLRAQAYTVRLAYKQSIASYIYAWKQLVATLGVRQLPLTDVAGRIDQVIPYFEYDAVLGHILRNHTDVLTARNAVDKARFNLKLAQITPFSDVEVNVGVSKEFVLPPQQVSPSATVSVTVPIWDQNRGNIISAEAALVRASEEPHRVEVALTSALATNYVNYKNNLDALEYYRKYILPDQVRTYRGVILRRHVDIAGVTFGDFVSAQQTLAANVSTYLSILGSLWTSVVSVADLLQTDDLFQLGQPRELVELPDLDHLPPWPCNHGAVPALPGHACLPAVPAVTPTLDAPRLMPPANGDADRREVRASEISKTSSVSQSACKSTADSLRSRREQELRPAPTPISKELLAPPPVIVIPRSDGE
jgi:cobalt-zinc-cadmium efflux system outer membrane protein